MLNLAVDLPYAAVDPVGGRHPETPCPMLDIRYGGLMPTRLERTYQAPAEVVWQMLTTATGLDRWWAPEGFETQVSEIGLRPGGEVRYTMTATAPEQVRYMEAAGLPLSSELYKTFTEVVPPARLGYRTVVDFVPGHEAYVHLTTIELFPAADGTRLVMTLDPLHDEQWTRQHHAHRESELDRLGAALRRP
ncbi:SRPBCC family protein [Hamadaea tsunoensis]|uniref:SRPBCC family protein n=1 Tax=Hamadaea tsunoensis TaxID=53368 RepID=UPI0003F8A670|nr:SRPBCC domain-containing protein [Hamadaea tsunoensis]